VLNQQLMVRNLRQGIDNAKFEGYLMPVDQFGGLHIQLPTLVPLLPFATVKDPQFGRIDAKHACYEPYRKVLKRTVDEPFALMLPCT